MLEATSPTPAGEAPLTADENFQNQYYRVAVAISKRATALASLPTTSNAETIESALRALPKTLPSQGLGLEATTSLLLDQVCPALSGGQAGPRFFGLVTGGVTPSAQLADYLVTSYDPCVQVHVPEETISTSIEHQTLQLVLELLSLSKTEFNSNTFTTGATASNLLGLILGREHVISRVQTRKGIFSPSAAGTEAATVVEPVTVMAESEEEEGDSIKEGDPTPEPEGPSTEELPSETSTVVDPPSSTPPTPAVEEETRQPWRVSEDGFGGVDVDVFCAGAHASIAKSASLAGIGRSNVYEILLDDVEQPCAFDLVRLEERLKANVGKRGSIVVSTFGEVNTGGFTPSSVELRRLCDEYDGWLHCDAAFGAFAVLHPDFEHITQELGLADSITSDAHKWLNVPYDCGIFLSKDRSLLRDICGGSASIPYLASGGSTEGESDYPLLDGYRSLPLPLFVNIENSRRFRALPVYASLLSLGRDGYAEIFQRNIEFARKVENWMRNGGAGGGYDVLLPPTNPNFKTMNVVLFAPSSSAPEQFQGATGSLMLGKAVNASREMYVTPSKWRGRGALRLAVSNWATELDRDFDIVIKVLESVMAVEQVEERDVKEATEEEVKEVGEEREVPTEDVVENGVVTPQ